MPNHIALDGLPIVDAVRDLAVTITANDIAGADMKRPESCAAARAIVRVVRAAEARVYKARVYVRTRGKWTRYITPASLKHEIVAFDRGGSFEPGTFILRPPVGGQKLGAPHTDYTNGKRPRTKPRRPIVRVANVRARGKI